MKLAGIGNYLRKKPYMAFLIIVAFLVKLPPFYIIPGINASNSLNLIRLAIILAFVILLFINKSKPFFLQFKSRRVILIFLGYFLSQSISILYAINVGSYLNVYKDIVISALLFMALLQIEKKDVFVLTAVFISSVLVNIMFQLTFILLPSLIDLIRPVLNTVYMQFVNYQTDRGRFFGDTLDEALIPLFAYYSIRARKKPVQILFLLVVVAIIFLVTLSSWRTKFIILVFSIISTFLLFKELRKYVLAFVITLFFVFIASNVISIRLVGQNIYDRLLSSEEVTEKKIERSRLSYLKDAYEIGFIHPVTGVGLGNYYDNLSAISKNANQSPPAISGKRFILVDDPHNIFFGVFATTGIAGLLSVLILLLYFFVTDIPVLLRNNFTGVFIIAFWGYFIFAFFNPWMYFSFLAPFWFIRGIIEKLKSNHE